MLEAAVYHHEDAENRFTELGVQTNIDHQKATVDYSPVKKLTQGVPSSRSISNAVSNRSALPLGSAASLSGRIPT